MFRLPIVKFFSRILNRITITVVLVALQVAWVLWAFFSLTTGRVRVHAGLPLLSLFMMLYLVRKDENSAYKIGWIALMGVLPLLGGALYLSFGNKRPAKRLRSKLQAVDEAHRADLVQQPDQVAGLDASGLGMSRYLARYGRYPAWKNTAAQYFACGEAMYPQLLQDLERAEHTIFVEYFIVHTGKMWDGVEAILRRKAAQGVDVRLIYDGFGSMFTLPGDYDEEIRRAGIKCHVFNALHFSLHISDYKMLNHRDHRKITVVDGETAFTGGLNFADEYINRKQRCGVWKDTGLMLKGPGVYPLTVTFLKMWDFVAGTTTPYTDYMPLGEYEADGYVQPYCDSPLDGEAVAESAYLNVLQHARDYVYIVTPYLIVDNEMVTALCLAAKSGVDVRILTPGVPDKWYVYYVTQSYYPRLLEAGVRIYEYTPGFVHAKMYVSDDREAIVGSANMDYRSLYLHFENCCAFYGGHMVRDVLEDVRATLAESHEVTMADVLRTPLYKWLAQVFLRFFSPLM